MIRSREAAVSIEVQVTQSSSLGEVRYGKYWGRQVWGGQVWGGQVWGGQVFGREMALQK